SPDTPLFRPGSRQVESLEGRRVQKALEHVVRRLLGHRREYLPGEAAVSPAVGPASGVHPDAHSVTVLPGPFRPLSAPASALRGTRSRYLPPRYRTRLPSCSALRTSR